MILPSIKEFVYFVMTFNGRNQNKIAAKEKIKIHDIFKISNIISIFRLLVSFFILSAFIFDIKLRFIQVVYLIGVFSDKLDGIIARKYRTETRLGIILEGIADGALIFSGILYITFNLDFPFLILIISFLIFGIGFFGNVIVYAMIKKWYTVRLLIFKISVLIAHLLIIIYLFGFSFKLQVAYGVTIFGVLLLFYYFWRIIKFVQKNLKVKYKSRYL